MLKNVEMGANFYKELGKLEKQLAKYQSKVLEIKTQNTKHKWKRLKSNIFKLRKRRI